MRVRDRLTSLGDSDRGATAVLVAASLVMLMGFAALAVDSGIAFNDRRQQASAADGGALAALQFAKTTLATTHPDCTGLTGKDKSACRGAEEAIAVIDGTLPGRYDDAAWGACDDPEDDLPPNDYTQHSFISDCISFTENFQRSRVVLPGTDVETAFGKAIGFNTIRVSAFAEAGLEMNIVGGVLPFAVGPSAGGADQACFAAGDNAVIDIDPCSDGVEGTYGKLDVTLYGNEDYGTPTICTGSNAQRMSTNLVTGTDHPMKPNPPEPGDPMKPVINDVANCNIISNEVNQVEVLPGNAQGAIADGLWGSIGNPSLEGRLRCKDGDAGEGYPLGTLVSPVGSWPCVDVVNNHPEALDHTPLWHYIDYSAPGWAGTPCRSSLVVDRTSMEACLSWYKSPGNKPTLFTEAIATSPRFAGVPRLDQDPGLGNSIKYTIKEFLPVYVETLYLGCNANTCSVVHSPGENSAASPPPACPTPLTAPMSSCGWTGNGNKLIEAITGFILTLDMLPDSIAENFPFQPGTVVYNLHR